MVVHAAASAAPDNALHLLLCSSALLRTLGVNGTEHAHNTRVAQLPALQVAQATAEEASPLAGMTDDAAARWLIQQTGEHVGLLPLFTKRVAELGKQVVWQCLQEAKQQHGSTTTADGSRPRSLGGVFIKLLNAQRHGGNMRIAAAGAAPQALRPYQARVVEVVVSSPGNWLVVSKTGSGKTAIAIEISRRLVAANAGAKVLMLVPQVVLSTQQAAAFLVSGFPAAVGAFNSDAPLTPTNWRRHLTSHGVLVCTAQCVVNVLRDHPRALDQLALLVLDEAHNATQDHPYAQVMRVYNQTGCTTRVLGLTASPACHITPEGTASSVQRLTRLLQAQLFAIPETDRDVQAVTATSREVDITVAPRARDLSVWQALLQVLLHALQRTNECCEDLRMAGPCAAVWRQHAEQLSALVEALACAPSPEDAPALLRGMRYQACAMAADTPLLAADRALRLLCDATRALPMPRELKLCVAWLLALRTAMDLTADAGFEAGLQFLAAKLQALLASRVAASNATNQLLTEAPSHTALLDPTIRKHLGRVQALASLEAVPCPAGFSLAALARDAFGGGVLGTWQTARDALPASQLHDGHSHPKLLALVAYLSSYASRQAFHGIVFVRQRQVVHYLAATLRVCDRLSFVDSITPFVGKGESAGRDAAVSAAQLLGVTSDATLPEEKGMGDGAQQRAMQAFKAPGRRLLIATSAAEEGLDVPSCEFVVRYDPAVSGVQRAQSRGRSRVVHSSEFVSLLQQGGAGMDLALHDKSTQEERNMKAFLAAHAR